MLLIKLILSNKQKLISDNIFTKQQTLLDKKIWKLYKKGEKIPSKIIQSSLNYIHVLILPKGGN